MSRPRAADAFCKSSVGRSLWLRWGAIESSVGVFSIRPKGNNGHVRLTMKRKVEKMLWHGSTAFAVPMRRKRDTRLPDLIEERIRKSVDCGETLRWRVLEQFLNEINC